MHSSSSNIAYGPNSMWSGSNIGLTDSLIRNVTLNSNTENELFSVSNDVVTVNEELSMKASNFKITASTSSIASDSSNAISKSYLDTQLSNLSNTYETVEDHASDMALKANASDVYTKTQTDSLLSVKANSSDVYSKTQTDSLLAAKANSNDVYTKTETDNAIADAIDSIPGADLSNYYNKTQSDSRYFQLANIVKTTDSTSASDSNVYSAAKTTNLLATKASSNDVYTKTETDNTFLTQSNAASTYQPKLTDSYIKVLRHQRIGYFVTDTSSNYVFKESPTSICQIWLDYSNFTGPSRDDIFEIWIRGTLVVSSSTSSLPETFVGKGDGAAGMTSLIIEINGIGIPLNWAVRTFTGGVITIDINTTAKLLATDIILNGGTCCYGFIYYYSANYTKNQLTFTQQYDVYATHYRVVTL